jgi:uncharacterized membrane protein YoaK (UPF0700 family)
MAALRTDEPGTTSLMLAALAFAAGYMDAASYLGLGRVFTANMTGNTVLLGIAIAGLHTARVVGSLVALVGFCAGVVAGAAVISTGKAQLAEAARAWRALACETVVVLLMISVWLVAERPTGSMTETTRSVLIAMSAVGMGMQTEAARCMSVGGVSTTYITGTLSDISAAVAAPLLRRGGRTRSHCGCDRCGGPLGTFLLAVWPVYLAGGAAGAFAVTRWAGRALVAPVCVLGAVSAIAFVERRRWRRAAQDSHSASG